MRAPVNAVRLTLHPAGLGQRIVNYAAWRAHVLTGLRQQIDARADPVIQGLFAEVSAYPAPLDCEPVESFGASERLATPLRIATRFGVMSFLGTVTVFGTPNDVTLSELALEMLFPADEKTAQSRERWRRSENEGGLRGSGVQKKPRFGAFFCLFCWLRSVFHRHPILVGAAYVFTFVLAPFGRPIFCVIYVEFAVDDRESLRIDGILVPISYATPMAQ